jgi:uncharacterized protein (TIGR02453 family)
MSADQAFGGFSADGLLFLQELATNNNRDWFEAHKQTYLDRIISPAQVFVTALGERLRTLSPDISYDTRTNGAGSITRIYRDIRFSADKSPYKTNLGMTFGPTAVRKGTCAGYMVHVDATGAAVYTGMHMFAKPHLEAFRAAVVDEALGTDLEAAIAAVSTTGAYTVGGETLKRVPAGFDADQPRVRLLRYTGLYAYSQRIDPVVVSSPQLVDACFEHCRGMLPLYQWLGRLDVPAGATR